MVKQQNERLRIGLVGGNVNNGTNAGSRNFNSTNAPGNANGNIGSRLNSATIKDSIAVSPCLLAKYNQLKPTLVTQRERVVLAKPNIMKRHGNLFEKVVSKDNIKLAIYKAAKGKSNRKEVVDVLTNIEQVVNDIHNKLVNEVYRQGPYNTFERRCGKKNRIIYKSSFYPDRIVHHCIINVLEPIWLKQIIRDTYGSVPGRGIHDAVYRIKEDLKDVQGTTYCLKIDFAKFYQSIPHESMKKAIRRKIKDHRLLRLIDDNIDSTEGLALGSFTSQWFGNIMLDELDHQVKELLKIKYYYRYCDDIVLLSSTKQELWNALSFIMSYADRYGLKIKSNYQVYPLQSRGLDFLGYRFFHGYTLMRKSIVKRFKRRLNSSDLTLKKALPSYLGWFKHADTFRLIKKYKTKWNNQITN